MSLARGLDYYTGVIYEAVLEGTNFLLVYNHKYDRYSSYQICSQQKYINISFSIVRISYTTASKT